LAACESVIEVSTRATRDIPKQEICLEINFTFNLNKSDG